VSTLDAAGWIRERVFPRAGLRDAARMGVEAELLAFDAETREPVRVNDRLLPFLIACTSSHHGRVHTGLKGCARVSLPGGGTFTFEPGGQLEYASPPFHEPSRLIRDLEKRLLPLVSAARDEGIVLLGAGIDPFNDPGRVPLQIVTDRYCRMDAYFESIGAAGRRMMRQTAGIQVNIDATESPDDVWQLLNAAAPFLTALFANSRTYAGADTGFASYRAETWRHTDGRRTGIFACDSDAVSEYARFALEAPAMDVPRDDGYASFEECWREGRFDGDAWAHHLTTLFPEIRPKGYFEIRSIDAQPPEQMALPVLLCAGLVLDAGAQAEAARMLGSPDIELLHTAGRDGLGDPVIESRCRDLVTIALEGCRRLGVHRCHAADIERAEARARELLSGRRPQAV
jgi:glutamate--cysteine ligase